MDESDADEIFDDEKKEKSRKTGKMEAELNKGIRNARDGLNSIVDMRH